MTKIVNDYPPMFDEINRRFKVLGKPVIFAWGHTIYNPMSITVTPALKAHERVHGARQLVRPDGVEGWWKEYLDNDLFRAYEEGLAHLIEYRHELEHARNRKERRRALNKIATKYASPLYGRVIPLSRAKKILRIGDVNVVALQA